MQRHGNGKSAHPTPGSLCGRGWPRAVFEGFIKFGWPTKKKIYYKLNIFLPPIQLTMPPKWWHCAAPMRPARHISPPCSPPSRPPVFGWLLCFDLLIGSRLTPPWILCSLFLRCSIWRPKRWDSVSPCAPPPTRHLSRFPSTANSDTQLVVVSSF